MEKNCKVELKIEGMTCINCELRIENELNHMDGVVDAKVSYANSSAKVTYDSKIVSIKNILDAIKKLDYNATVYQEESSSEKKNKSPEQTPAGQWIGIGIILLAGYLVINNTIGFNFIPDVTQNMGYGILFVVGLITSLHCVAMCGGINLSQCVSYKFTESDTKWSKLKPSLMYNAGRVVSYTVIGGIVGALGSVISFSGTAKGIVAILSGIFMVIMGINMMNLFPWLRKFTPHMPKRFGNKIYQNSGKHGPFYVGLLNGLMPCGPLQTMQIYALGTGSFWAGALSMFVFSVGTVPLMFGFGAISSFLSSKFTHKMMKASAVLVVLLGVVMLNRGFALSGFNFMGGVTAQASSSATAKIEGNVQVVTTKLQSGGYTPFVVQKGVPVEWTIQAEKGTINGCNRTIIIPQYNITVDLKQGDNVVKFTPQESGNISYSCWMGMIRSNISVVEDLTNFSEKDVQQPVGGVTAGGGCCGGAF